jgi:hypothetical protein
MPFDFGKQGVPFDFGNRLMNANVRGLEKKLLAVSYEL